MTPGNIDPDLHGINLSPYDVALMRGMQIAVPARLAAEVDERHHARYADGYVRGFTEGLEHRRQNFVRLIWFAAVGWIAATVFFLHALRLMR